MTGARRNRFVMAGAGRGRTVKVQYTVLVGHRKNNFTSVRRPAHHPICVRRERQPLHRPPGQVEGPDLRAASVRDGIRAALSESDGRVAAIAIACVAAFIGLITKGMFESIFEKYRLALLLGALAGVSVSFAAERLKAAESVRDALRLDGLQRVMPQ